jgi:hypothetical protein
MSKQSEELERLKRIRQQQISARDPTLRDKRFHGTISARRKASKYTWRDMLKDMQLKWTWMFAGGLIGLVFGLVFASAIEAAWADYAGIFMILMGIALGRLLGAVMDWRNDDWGKR